MLFEWDMTRQETGRVEKLFWKSAHAADSTREIRESIIRRRGRGSPAADKLSAELSENWRLERLATVDRGILRLAIYELRSGTAPAKVVIDEALELAKKFSSAEAPRFLNGILGAALKKIEG